MTPNPPLGVFLHAVGGLCAGSFYAPLRQVRRWAWESYWLAMGVFAWILAPFVVAMITNPDLSGTLTNSPWSAIGLAYLFGAVWGIGSATFGLTMRYLGMALGMAVALGFCAAFGTLIPPLVKGELVDTIATPGGRVALGGVALCLAGIAICGYAGVCKERELSDEEKQATIAEFAVGRGLIVGVIAGIMSAGFNYGLTAGEPIAAEAVKAGADDLFKNNAVILLVTLGGFTVNLPWCIYLGVKNRSLGDYLASGAGPQVRNYALCAISGIVWYGQFFFYGMGTTKLGEEYDFSSWTLHMAFIIIFSNLWGLILREWRGASLRTMLLVSAGILTLIGSTVVIGMAEKIAAWLAAF